MISRVGKTWIWTMVQAILTAILIALLYWAWLIVRSSDNFPVRYIKVLGTTQHIPVQKVQQLIIQNFQGGFFSYKSGPIKDALLSNAWLGSVSMRRVWPDMVEVTVTEKVPVLQWNTNKLADASGNLFEPPVDTIPKNLPQLFGPEDNFKEVFTKYQEYREALSGLGLGISNLKLSDRLSWTVELNNNISVILGEKNPDARLERFVNHYKKLIGDNARCVQYVDLRYPDGITIKWQNLDKTHQCPPAVLPAIHIYAD
jgi:cell division protein FtsQ